MGSRRKAIPYSVECEGEHIPQGGKCVPFADLEGRVAKPGDGESIESLTELEGWEPSGRDCGREGIVDVKTKQNKTKIP